MNKKFLSAVLFGALMVSSTGTFTSCKDYDDDIDNLQEQIDKLATKEDMSSQIATLQAALNTAAKDASDAISKATAAEAAAKAAGDEAAAAKAAADKAVAAAKEEAIKAAQAEVNAAKAELEKLVADGLGENKAELEKMAKKVEEATKKVEEIVGEITSIVTSVELVDSYSADNGQYNEEAAVLKFASAIVEKDFTFLKDVTGAIEFKKGDQEQTTDEFVVRVTPSNAVLKPEMISLVNSKGENLNDFIVVNKVEKYDGLLSRGVSETGLWKVTVQLDKYNKDAFNAATLVDPSKEAAKGNYKLFAVQVNNTLSSAPTRFATSSFDLSIEKDIYTPKASLDFFVDGTPITSINNRVYGKTGNSLTTSDKIEYQELIWKNGAKADVIAPNKTNATTSWGYSTLKNDDRSEEKVLLAVQGNEIKIELADNIDAEYKDIEAPSEIKAIYVTLDKQNAVQSLNSEINVWGEYDYTGLDKVVPGTSTTIKVDYDKEINDIIGFRVWAVNRDGKLVDPDGRAFYVQIGKAGEDWNTTATKVVAGITAPNKVSSSKTALSLSKITGAHSFTWSTDKCAKEHTTAIFNIAIYKNNEILFSTNTNDNKNTVAGIKFEEATSVVATPACSNWLDYVDNKAYNGTLTIKNQTGFVVATLNVSMTKVLPEGMPEGYSLKDKQVINGIYNCYMIASDLQNGQLVPSWDATDGVYATYGVMPIENLINFGDKNNATNYEVTFAESADDTNKDGKKETVLAKGNEEVKVTAAYVDNKTEHATIVSYNYGKISTETKDADGKVADYKQSKDSFKTVYCCFYKKDVHTWNWATRAQLGGNYNKKDENGNWLANPLSTTLTYGNPVNAQGTPTETAAYNAFVFGKNAIDGTFSTLLSKVYANSLSVESAKLISNATQKEDYFSVSKDLKFTPIKIDLGSNPKENVPSTLIVNCKDSYGHDVVITLDMTVAPRK